VDVYGWYHPITWGSGWDKGERRSLCTQAMSLPLFPGHMWWETASPQGLHHRPTPSRPWIETSETMRQNMFFPLLSCYLIYLSQRQINITSTFFSSAMLLLCIFIFWQHWYWIQGFILARQILYHLSPVVSLGYFGQRGSHFSQASPDHDPPISLISLLLGWQVHTTRPSFFPS
jgi:hypothetical protein